MPYAFSIPKGRSQYQGNCYTIHLNNYKIHRFYPVACTGLFTQRFAPAKYRCSILIAALSSVNIL